MTIRETRSSQVDVEKCVHLAGNRFDLIIGTSQRMRELKTRAREKGTHITAVDPLLEMQNGNLNITDYLLKVK